MINILNNLKYDRYLYSTVDIALFFFYFSSVFSFSFSCSFCVSYSVCDSKIKNTEQFFLKKHSFIIKISKKCKAVLRSISYSLTFK